MKNEVKAKGTWIHRIAIRFFTLVLAILVYWVLGFLVQDIRTIKGPDYGSIEKKHLDPALVSQRNQLQRQIRTLTKQIGNQQEKQRILGNSSDNLQKTIGQLLEVQKIGLQKNVSFSAEEQTNFTTSLNLFLDNQRKYQALSQTISETVDRKQALEREMEQAEQQIERQKAPAHAEYSALRAKHRLRLAFLQLAVLLPILGLAATLVIRKRRSIYFPLFLAFCIASFLKVALVVHEYFPTRYFKYLLIGGLLVAVARLLIHFIRTIAFPKTEWLVKQYREAYERFLCPVCEYPIRTGPRRFLFWTRRTVNKIIVPGGMADQANECYTCPSCGNTLFEECPSCDQIRHALLPNCSHCGAEKEFPSS